MIINQLFDNLPLHISNGYYPNVFYNLPCNQFFHIDIDNLCDLKIKLKYLPDGYEKEISGQHSTQPI